MATVEKKKKRSKEVQPTGSTSPPPTKVQKVFFEAAPKKAKAPGRRYPSQIASASEGTTFYGVLKRQEKLAKEKTIIVMEGVVKRVSTLYNSLSLQIPIEDAAAIFITPGETDSCAGAANFFKEDLSRYNKVAKLNGSEEGELYMPWNVNSVEGNFITLKIKVKELSLLESLQDPEAEYGYSQGIKVRVRCAVVPYVYTNEEEKKTFWGISLRVTHPVEIPGTPILYESPGNQLEEPSLSDEWLRLSAD